jgi:hypothetical protein
MAEHLSYDELKELLYTYGQKIPIGSVWTHWKKPDVQYTISDLVIDETTDSVSVIYECNEVRFSRLADIFLENVDKPEYQ